MVMPSFECTQLSSARQILLEGLRDREPQNRVRKVILSATMTRDLTKLASLKLNRPTLVAVVEPQNEDVDVGNNESTVGVLLPDTLKESAVPVGDGSEKPIQLLQLLHEHFDISATTSSTALVFCSSDDNATRLARLLTLLSPEQESRLATLTKATTAASRRATQKRYPVEPKSRPRHLRRSALSALLGEHVACHHRQAVQPQGCPAHFRRILVGLPVICGELLEELTSANQCHWALDIQ